MREKTCAKNKLKSLGLFNQLDMVGGCRHVIGIQTEKGGKSDHPVPPQPACHNEMTWPSGRTLRTSDPRGMIFLGGFDKVGWEIQEAIDPNGIKGFGHIKDNHAC